jgi:hypothetical protein
MNEHGKYKTIPAMTPTVVHDYLRKIGSEWQRKGVAMELGSWLGGTAVPLLEGLVQAKYNRPFYCFDKWEANLQQVASAKSQGLQIRNNQDLVPIFLSNTRAIYDNVACYVGNISATIQRFPGVPIEICLFDAPKQEPTFTNAINVVIPHFIPGVTIFGLLDYNFWKKRAGKEREQLLAPVKWMEAHKDYFEQLMEWPEECSCVFFKYIKKI